MATAFDVLVYMKSLGQEFTGEVQAQKLVYYAQAWTVAWDGAPLFDEPIQAWEMGPVVPSLRHRLRVVELLGQDETSRMGLNLSAQQRENIKAVVAYYGGSFGGQLIDLTHTESPWMDTFHAEGATNRETIPLALMRAEYTRQSIDGIGPKRVFLGQDQPDPANVLGWTDAAVQQWSHTLALLQVMVSCSRCAKPMLSRTATSALHGCAV